MLDAISLSVLQKSKLTDKQAKVYLATLQLGKATLGQIAAVAGLKRSITYIIIDTLLVSGYISVDLSSRRKFYTAADPNAIATELDQSAQDFREMLPYLRNMQHKAAKPAMHYFQGLESVRHGLKQIRKPKEARYASSIAKASLYFPEEVARWQKTYMQGKGSPGGRHILMTTPADRDYGHIIAQAGQLVRYLPEGQTLDMDLALIDGKIFLTSFEKDIAMTVIDSFSLYNSLASLYDVAWGASGS